MIIDVSDEGIQYINKLISAINDGIENISKETDQMTSLAEGYADTLGPHHKSLMEALEAIQDAVKESTSPASEVAEKLVGVAKDYQDMINDDPFASGN